MLTSLEICAGAGGQALGLAMAGFHHVALVEYEEEYCKILKRNRPEWNVICEDLHKFDGTPYKGIDLLAGGVPCPPFSVAGKQLGNNDERDLFPEALRLVSEIQPKAVMLENVKGFLDPRFNDYRESILNKLVELGYNYSQTLLNAAGYGVPQLRPRVVIVAIRKDVDDWSFHFPEARYDYYATVGKTLGKIMGSKGWEGAVEWAKKANTIAPTLVGGSKKHGGPDLGPTRARAAWEKLGVDGTGVADEPPSAGFVGMPRLTKEMLALLQGFPPEWTFGEKKTLACRMIGNAFPPPVACAVGLEIKRCLE